MKTPRWGWLGWAVWAATAAFSGRADDTGMVLNLSLPWTLGSGVSPRTEQWHAEHAGTSFQVFVNEPGKGVNLNYPVPLRVDPRQTPTLALTYRATNLRTNEPQKDVFAFYDDGVPSELCVVRHRDLVADSQVHTLRIDLAEKLAEKKAGPEALNCLDIRVHDANAGSCAFELMDLRFERASAAAVASNNISDRTPGTPVRVHVVDPAGSPVAGATVTLDAHLRDFSVTAATDADGRAAVCATRTDQPLTRRSLLVTKEGCVQVLFCDLSDVDAKTELTVSLYPARTVGGLVVDESGHPVAGAVGDVSLGYWPRQERLGHPLRFYDVSRISANANGRWSSPPLPVTSDMDVQVRWRQAGYLEDRWGGHYSGRVPFSALREWTARSILKRGIALTGCVTGTNGLPIAGAVVAQGEDRICSNPAPLTTTDADGRYRFESAPPGAVVLTVSAKGYAPQLIQTEVRAGMPPVDFKLAPPAIFRFRVVDTAQKPLKGVHICPDTWKGFRTLDTRFFTDAAGEAAWKGPPDPVVFDIFVEGKLDCRGTAFAPSKDEQDVHAVVLQEPLQVDIAVTDAKTGDPVPRFKVVTGILWTNESERGPSWLRNDERDTTGHDGHWTRTFNFDYPHRVFRIEADGYAPAVSQPVAKDAGHVALSLRLQPAKALTGTLVDPDGQPVAGAKVFLAIGKDMPRIRNGRIEQDDECATATTDAAGLFTFPSQGDERIVLMALEETGYVIVEGTDLTAAKGVAKLQRWGTVTGTLYVGDQPAPGERVEIQLERTYDAEHPWPYHFMDTTTDAQGRFGFERVPAGRALIGRFISIGRESSGMAHSQPLDVIAGGTVAVKIGGTGQPVAGRYVWPQGVQAQGLDAGFHGFRTKSDRNTLDKQIKQCLPEGFDAWEREKRQAFLGTKEGKAIQAQIDQLRSEAGRKIVCYDFAISANGSFRIENVEPGDYELSLQAYAPLAGRGCGWGDPIARHALDVHVPALPAGVAYVAEPLNLGELVVKPIAPPIQVGQPAPNFTVHLLNPEADTQDVTRVDGPTFKLSDYRGKVVLVDFWATWCGPCVAETPHLKAVCERFGAEPRFVMIGLSLDAAPEAPARYARQNKLGWRQGFLGEWSKSSVPETFGVRGIPSIWLIGPDGVVIAAGLRGEKIGAAIADALRARVAGSSSL